MDVMTDGNFLLGMRVHYGGSNFKTIAIGSQFNQQRHKMESAKFDKNEFITQVGLRARGAIQSMVVGTNLGKKIRFGSKDPSAPEQMIPLEGSSPRVVVFEPYFS